MKLLIKVYRYLRYGPITMVPMPVQGIFLFVDNENTALACYDFINDTWEPDMEITDDNFFRSE